MLRKKEANSSTLDMNVRGDWVQIVFGTQTSGGERGGIISWSMHREGKAVEHYPAMDHVQDIVPREERGTESRNPR